MGRPFHISSGWAVLLAGAGNHEEWQKSLRWMTKGATIAIRIAERSVPRLH